MASLVYTPAKESLAKATLAWHTADLRAALLMTNTSADTDQDAATLSAIGTLDEYDGSGYVRLALAGEAVNRDDPNNRAECDCDDLNFGVLGAGTRSVQGLLIYKYVDGTAANDVPVLWSEFASTWNGSGLSVLVQINAEGLLQIT